MKGITAVFYRDYRQRITNIGFVFWDMFVPLAYLTLFGMGFERALGTSLVVSEQAVEYTTFLLPGVIAMISFSVAMNASWGFFMDKDSGIFYELLTYPITRQQLLIGKICFNVVLSLIGSVLHRDAWRRGYGRSGSLGLAASHWCCGHGDDRRLVFFL